MDIQHPPIKVNKQGGLRRVGLEIEYSGVPLEESAEIIAATFGGKPEEVTRSHFKVETPEYGEFAVKLDVSFMQRLSEEAAQKRRENQGEPSFEIMAESVLGTIVSTWMPNEIVTPPLPVDRIGDMQKICAELARRGGKGTGASPVYAFGMHINPEMPDIAPSRLRDYIAAFILLQEWLKQRTQMDLTRQFTTYARLFANDYAQIMLYPGYAPDFDTLVDDYLLYNPTRNRALDMLPMFAWFDEEKIQIKVGDARVRKRPTFHYRLPNCDLDMPAWSIAREWDLWLEVEKLAEDADKLRRMSAAYLSWYDSALERMLGSWAEQTNPWIAA